ncbi:hypothetical protein [Streptomyces sp. NPDC001508]|uniref:hypothetical protein n=1 Tax=Streptomyces sp. NPDC001508 TaxID=3154656 RepID=UPI0033204D2E
MEQRIGSSSQPLEGAGFDPAFIPGITAPVPADRKDTEAEDAVETEETASARDTEAPAAEAEEGAEAAQDKAEAEDEDAKAEAEDGQAEGEDAKAEGEDAKAEGEDEQDGDEGEPDGPVFEAADRRARIVADRKGVRLRLDEESCEFRWDEIGAVETEAPRFGKRFTVTVHTPDRRWYPIEIEATARARFKEWEEQLDAVLDAYFEV